MAQGTANVELVYQWKDESIVGSAAYNNAYNETWGFVQNNHEFAVIGSTEGTHIFDVTDTENISQVAFIEGAITGPIIIHRDYHDYNGFLYIVADEGPSTLQIVDISDLPNSFEKVYDSSELIIRSHNIFIDTATATLYSCGGATFMGGGTFAAFSLENPTQPSLIANYSNSPWGYVHDAYVKDNIGYLHCGGNGFYIVDFSDVENPEVLGVLDSYSGLAYNHSGWLSEDGQTYIMCDEAHGRDVYLLDVSDPTDIKVASTINSGGSETQSIAHNVIVRGNYAFVSYYYDGLHIFDLSEPETPCQAGNYDTSQWGYDNNYRGNWGLYCHLPSGLVVASDMQEGLFVFKIVEAETTDVDCPIQPSWCGNCVEEVFPTNNKLVNALNVNVFPTIFSESINIESPQVLNYSITNLSGKLLLEGITQNHTINKLNILKSGIYILQLSDGEKFKSIKIVKQ